MAANVLWYLEQSLTAETDHPTVPVVLRPRPALQPTGRRELMLDGCRVCKGLGLTRHLPDFMSFTACESTRFIVNVIFL